MVVTVIQARMGSSRLPGKVLFPLGRGSVLSQMVARVRRARRAGLVVVATTTLREDDVIADHCARFDTFCFRGHPTDLLDRHYRIARRLRADAVVKIPSDCPLIDPAIVDEVIGEYAEGAYDYVSNLHPPSYPDGNDVEIMRFSALEAAWREATRPAEREHTTPFLWKRPERFRLGNVSWKRGLDWHRTHRLTLDYREDYELIRSVYERLAPRPFGLEDILRLLEREPCLHELNRCRLGDFWYVREGFA